MLCHKVTNDIGPRYIVVCGNIVFIKAQGKCSGIPAVPFFREEGMGQDRIHHRHRYNLTKFPAFL